MSNSTIKPSEEAVDDGKNHYISTLEYIGSLKHLDLDLKCEVVHKGYKEEQLDQFENIVQAKFNIPKPSPVDCELGPWNECNATCGTGMQSRIIVQEALYGGKECSTNRTIECNLGSCPTVPPVEVYLKIKDERITDEIKIKVDETKQIKVIHFCFVTTSCCTGKSLSEALILASTNPQYDSKLFNDLQVQYKKIPKAEHVKNVSRTCYLHKLF